jgi:hypothetical protein
LPSRTHLTTVWERKRLTLQIMAQSSGTPVEQTVGV